MRLVLNNFNFSAFIFCYILIFIAVRLAIFLKVIIHNLNLKIINWWLLFGGNCANYRVGIEIYNINTKHAISTLLFYAYEGSRKKTYIAHLPGSWYPLPAQKWTCVPNDWVRALLQQDPDILDLPKGELGYLIFGSAPSSNRILTTSTCPKVHPSISGVVPS